MASGFSKPSNLFISSVTYRVTIGWYIMFLFGFSEEMLLLDLVLV